MRRANGMDVDSRSRFGETPRRARVIEMNVAEENVANVRSREPSLRKIDHDVVESGFGAGVEKRDAVIGLECSRGDDPGMAELSGIEDVEHEKVKSDQPSLKATAWQASDPLSPRL